MIEIVDAELEKIAYCDKSQLDAMIEAGWRVFDETVQAEIDAKKPKRKAPAKSAE